MPRGLTAKEFDKAVAFFQVAIPLYRAPYVHKKTGQMVEPKGCHSTFTGIGTDFKERFPGVDYVTALNELEEMEIIASVRSFKGAQLYLWADRPAGYVGRMELERRKAKISSAINEAMAKLEGDGEDETGNEPCPA